MQFTEKWKYILLLKIELTKYESFFHMHVCMYGIQGMLGQLLEILYIHVSSLKWHWKPKTLFYMFAPLWCENETITSLTDPLAGRNNSLAWMQLIFITFNAIKTLQFENKA